MIRNVNTPSRRMRKKAMRSRAWLDGVEVTSRCFYADDRRGVVGLFKVNANGSKYVEDARTGLPLDRGVHDDGIQPRVAREWKRGTVTIGQAA